MLGCPSCIQVLIPRLLLEQHIWQVHGLCDGRGAQPPGAQRERQGLTAHGAPPLCQEYFGGAEPGLHARP